MATPKIDHVSAGVVVVFDPETGDVLHTDEKFVETVNGTPSGPTEITPGECEEVRVAAVKIHPRRRLDAVVASAEFAPCEGSRLCVDPMTRSLRLEPDPEASVAGGLMASSRR